MTRRPRRTMRTRQVPGSRRLWNLGKRPQKRSRNSRPTTRLLVKIAKFGVFLCLVFVVYELVTLPFLSVVRLRTENPTDSAIMRQRIEEEKGKGKPLTITYRWVPLSAIPRHVQRAVVVSEDGMFFSHGGVDWYEVRKSLEMNVKQGRIVRGGSTITQQLAKNLFLSTSRDPVRKFKELLITWMLEFTLPKSRILELYLNVIEWGRGIFGVEAASQRYFQKPAIRLTKDEGARLAAVIPSPLRYQPQIDSDYVVKKKAVILRRMASRSF